MSNQNNHPKVFISYSWDSQKHNDQVRELCNRLREDGIDCMLDQFIPSPPEGWPRWMDNQIDDAQFVLAICTQRYNDRCSGRENLGIGNGVRWEGHLTYQHIYNTGSLNTKFIPVLLESGTLSDIPTPLQGSTFYRANTKDGYEDLYRRLTNNPRYIPSEVGQLRLLERTRDFSQESGERFVAEETNQRLLANLKALLQMQGPINEGKDGSRGPLFGTDDTYESTTWPREVEIVPTANLEGVIRIPYECMVRHRKYIGQAETATRDEQHPAIVTAKYSIDQNAVVHISEINTEGAQARRCADSIRSRINSLNNRKLL